METWDIPQVDIGNGEDTLLTELPVTLDAGSGYSSYLWQDNSTGESYIATEAGMYRVTISDSNGCLNSDSLYVTTNTSIQLAEGLGMVSIYPNPVQEILNVELEMITEKEVVIELYSMANVLVYRTDLEPTHVTEAHIDVQDLAPGVYALRITAGQAFHNFLVVVK